MPLVSTTVVSTIPSPLFFGGLGEERGMAAADGGVVLNVSIAEAAGLAKVRDKCSPSLKICFPEEQNHVHATQQTTRCWNQRKSTRR